MTLSQRQGVVEIVTPRSASIEAYKCSFFPQTIKDWNDLTDSLFSTAEMSDNYMCPSSLHSCVLGTNFSPIRTPGEIMSFCVSPVNYSDSEVKGLEPRPIRLRSFRHIPSVVHHQLLFCPFVCLF